MYNENIIESKKSIPERSGKYFAGIIICIILLYVFNNLLSLYLFSVPSGSNILKAIVDNAYVQIKIPFLADNFVSCLWSINLALGLGIMGNFWFLFYHPRWFFYFLQAILIAVGTIPVFVVQKIFPFVIESPTIHALINKGLWGFIIILGLISLFLLIKSAVQFIRVIRNFEPL